MNSAIKRNAFREKLFAEKKFTEFIFAIEDL